MVFGGYNCSLLKCPEQIAVNSVSFKIFMISHVKLPKLD